MMKHLLFVVCVLVGLSSPAWATTYYIDDAGSDAAAGTSTSVPWKTWSKALGVATSCGDTLIVMDGTYTTATHGNPTLTKVCTTGNPFTIQWQNQREALISHNGASSYGFQILGSAYIVVDGMRMKSADNSNFTTPGAVFTISSSNHITVTHPLLYDNNRYGNTHLLMLLNTTDSRVEDFELYRFHRHGILISNPGNPNNANNVLHNGYCHGRQAIDISGGYPSGPSYTADDCVALYPSSGNVVENVLAENVGKGFAVIGSSYNRRNQLLNVVTLGTRTAGTDSIFCMTLNTRGAGATYQVTDTVVRHAVCINNGNTTNGGGNAFDLRGNLNLQIYNSSAFNAKLAGFSNIIEAAFPQSTYSHFCTDCLATLNDTTGWALTGVTTWNWTDGTSFGNGTNYSPSSHANYNSPDTPATTDPQMGDCWLWPPDGSNAATNGWGATILYRYVDGVLTTTPLWDPTTGEFPHGAIVAGINDTASTSAYNVHERLHVGVANGCAFPSSFGGGSGAPTNPATHVSSTGTSSTSHSHTFDAGIEKGVVFVHLRDSASNVGSVSAVTGCGGEAYTFRKRATSTPTNPLHAIEVWTRDSPTSGVCTMAVSTSGAVTSMITTSIEVDGVHATTFGAAEGDGGLSATPSVTVATEANAVILSATSGTSNGTLSAGQNQTLQTDTLFAPSRLAVSQQSGTDGGVMDYLFNAGNSNWSTVAISFCPLAGCAGATNELNVTKYGFFSGFGTEAGSTALADTSTAVSIAPTGMVRLRAEITAEVATNPPFGFSLYCGLNTADPGDYTQALDTFGSNVFRLYGAGVDPHIPSSLADTTPRLTAPDANSVTGAFVRDQSSVFIAPEMATGKRLEMEWLLVLNATAGDTIDCEPRFDSGVRLTTQTVTPRINVITPSASGFASLPEQPTGLVLSAGRGF